MNFPETIDNSSLSLLFSSLLFSSVPLCFLFSPPLVSSLRFPSPFSGFRALEVDKERKPKTSFVYNFCNNRKLTNILSEFSKIELPWK